MRGRILIAAMVLFGVTTGANARKPRRVRASLVMKERGTASTNHGANLDPRTGTELVVPPPVPVSTSFVESHSARVENDIMLFPPTLIGITPRGRDAELFARSPEKKGFHFFTPAKAGDDLELRRDRDRLLLFREPQPQGAAVGLGMAMFGTMTMLSAHAPRALRALFDGPVHPGPAVFDGGGMGAGVAGRWL